MKRNITPSVLKDLNEKIVILSGPRQVGKTTLARQLYAQHYYLNYDSIDDRHIIQNHEWKRDVELLIFDELHKMKKWKAWIKGIYDTEGVEPKIIITGSAKLDTFKKGGDSLAGRHFYYRLHPLSVKEVIHQIKPYEALERLLKVGGFPEVFLKNDAVFAKRWRRTHLDVILRNDLLDLEKVRDIRNIEILIELLRERVGSTCSYSSLATDLQVSVPTIKHWLQILENLFVIFPVRPYSKNIARSLLKEPKYYFYDVGAVENGESARLENITACALLKELHFIEDTTGSKVSLHFLRNKEGKEIDFLTVIDKSPRQAIEVKWADDKFSSAFAYYKKCLPKDVKYYQIVYRLDKEKEHAGVYMKSIENFLANTSA